MEFLDQEAREELPQTQPMCDDASEEEEEEEEEEGPIRPPLKRSIHMVLDEEEAEEEAYQQFMKEKARQSKISLAECPEITAEDYEENSKPTTTLIVCSPKKKNKPRRIALETVEVNLLIFFYVNPVVSLGGLVRISVGKIF